MKRTERFEFHVGKWIGVGVDFDAAAVVRVRDARDARDGYAKELSFADPDKVGAVVAGFCDVVRLRVRRRTLPSRRRVPSGSFQVGAWPVGKIEAEGTGMKIATGSRSWAMTQTATVAGSPEIFS